MLCRLLRGRKKEEKQVEESSSFQLLFLILNSGLVTNLCISLPRGETFPTDLFALLF